MFRTPQKTAGDTFTISSPEECTVGESSAQAQPENSSSVKKVAEMLEAKNGTINDIVIKRKKLSQPSSLVPKVKVAVVEKMGSPNTPKTYSTRTEEGRACLSAAKLYISKSRNLKTELKDGMNAAIDRLYLIVKELEAELTEVKAGQNGNQEVGPLHPPLQSDTAARVDDELTLTLKQNNRLIQESMNEGMKEMMRKMDELRKSIVDNSKVVNENKERMERVYSSMENTTTVAKASYASVVSRGVSEGLPETRALHSVVVSSKDEQETGDEVMEKIRKTVDAKDGWVKVERVRKVKNRRVVVGCMNEEERNKVKERLSKNEGLVVEEVKNKNPLLAFRDVMKRDTADFVTAFYNQNAAILEGLKGEERKVEVVYVMRARNPLQNHVVVRASPQVWRRCVDGKYAHIGLGRVRVWDHSPLVQCSRCLGYGHTKRLCKEEMDRCSHCAGPHLRTDCEKWLRREVPQCINCTKAKKGSVEHSAFDRECVERKRWDALARSAVAYC